MINLVCYKKLISIKGGEFLSVSLLKLDVVILKIDHLENINLWINEHLMF